MSLIGPVFGSAGDSRQTYWTRGFSERVRIGGFAAQVCECHLFVHPDARRCRKRGRCVTGRSRLECGARTVR